MALRNIAQREKGELMCPRCGQKMLVIDGSFIKWLTCPSCKYRKLEEKPEEKKVAVTPILDSGQEPVN
ncbi:MAG: hypothetical protein QXU82_01980 [Candidatus Aenigmatarchaeota archaeon]